MLVHYNQVSDILYYEVLDIPLPELQCLKTLKVAFHHVNKEEPVIHNIRLPKQRTVGDVLSEIKSKIFPLSEKIENINDQYWTLRAEEIPEEEKNLGPQDHLIHVYHFTKEAAQNQMGQRLNAKEKEGYVDNSILLEGIQFLPVEKVSMFPSQ
ncbi:hypothetical protein L1987_60392 [Smallanthus sonchifolius]|uniref:Uncharacterized protein n=1 Tax=Smallanthus sonchifolius TaxID=185202 RepID=A0ACB9D7X0_9ASTR|nr:hypothetical protein L1987_60392 [Smallanthus sonchifolius]